MWTCWPSLCFDFFFFFSLQLVANCIISMQMTFKFIILIKQVSLSSKLIPVFFQNFTLVSHNIAESWTPHLSPKASSSVFHLVTTKLQSLTLHFLHLNHPHPLTTQIQLISLLKYCHLDLLPSNPFAALIISSTSPNLH